MHMRKKLLLGFCAMVLSIAMFAQTVVVTGKVTDEKGAALAGATVREKNTNNATSAGADGSYSIKVKPGTKLVISVEGYTNREIAAKAGAGNDVSLTVDTKNLTEVVVTALGVKREKKALGYAVATVDKKQLEQRPDGDVVRLLNGKAPGVDIGATSGLSGSGTNIIIRGVSSISGDATPLFIVDGVQFDGSTNAQSDFRYGNQTSSRFLDLDPNNIESVNVLKGLSATTLYGAQGRNGVVLITTKNGANTRVNKKTEVTVNQSFFTNTVANLPEYTDKFGGGFDMSTGLTFFSNWGAPFKTPPVRVNHPYNQPGLAGAFPEFQGQTYEYKPYRNTVKNFFRQGAISTTSINMKGSVGGVNLSANYSYLDDKGFTPGNSVNRNTFGIGGNAKLSNNITLNATFNFVNTDFKSPPNSVSFGSSAANGSGVFADLMYTPPAVDLMNLPYKNPLTGGSIYYRPANDIQNPRWTVENVLTGQKVNRTYGQISAKYDVLKNLNLTYRLGWDNFNTFDYYYQNKGGVQNPLGFMRTVNAQTTIWDHYLIGNYQTDLNEDWNLTVEAGVNSRQRSDDQTGVASQQQIIFGLFNHGNFINQAFRGEDGSNLNGKSSEQQIGVFTQGSFGYKDYMYVTIGGRNDWVSTLEANNRSLFYPSSSISFIPTSAIAALQNNKILNYAKVRAGYSTSARFPAPYRTRQALSVNANAFVDRNGTALNTNSIPNRLPNPDLKPELLQEFEVGFEGRLINNRVSVDFTYYNRVSKDQILTQALDPATGYTSKEVNGGDVSNKGIELQLGVTAVKNRNFSWQIDMNYTRNRSMVSNLPSSIKQIPVAGYTDLGAFAMNGQPLGVIQGYYVQRDPKSGQRVVNSQGNYISSNEIGIIGNPLPLWKGALINTVTYKGLSFRMQWDYTHGGDIYSTTVRSLLARGVTKDTEFDRYAPVILPGVLENGRPNNIQTSATNAYFANFGFGANDMSIWDGSVIRLREMSLSYSVPESALKKLPFGGISFTVSGQNLWYKAPNFPKYSNFDPETSGLGVGSYRGLEFITGPSSRRIGASIRVTF